ncbi:MAG: hypothetical protein K9G46_07370 [Flavobacteriales bacterium]|nr:hypothetical protein [Flavobacteriales bacterium]
MGALKINSKSIDHYFGYLLNLDNRSKKQLIIKLTKSIDENEPSNSGFDKLFGAWKDDRTAEEIIKDIRDSRTPNQ